MFNTKLEYLRNDEKLCCFILWLVLWVGVLVDGVVCGIMRNFVH